MKKDEASIFNHFFLGKENLTDNEVDELIKL